MRTQGNSYLRRTFAALPLRLTYDKPFFRAEQCCFAAALLSSAYQSRYSGRGYNGNLPFRSSRYSVQNRTPIFLLSIARFKQPAFKREGLSRILLLIIVQLSVSATLIFLNHPPTSGFLFTSRPPTHYNYPSTYIRFLSSTSLFFCAVYFGTMRVSRFFRVVYCRLVDP